MKPIKRRKQGKGLVPFSLRPRKKYPFRTPIPPTSVVRVKASPSRSWKKEVGRRFRIGYYSWQDGLDCIWLVNEEGKYEQTIDHEFLLKNFEIESIAKERSLYGRGRPQLGPMMRRPYGEQLEEA
jgi:hypothetical protein